LSRVERPAIDFEIAEIDEVRTLYASSYAAVRLSTST